MPEHKIAACFEITDLQQLIKQTPNQVSIIDVRNPEEYANNHISGAINIPLGELENFSNELSKHSLIITVCGKGGGRSAEAAQKLKQQGFTKAIYLCGGTLGWYEAIKQ